MSLAKQHFAPLTENQRLAYLDAMEVPVWVRRDQVVVESLETQQTIASAEVAETNTMVEPADVEVSPVATSVVTVEAAQAGQTAQTMPAPEPFTSVAKTESAANANTQTRADQVPQTRLETSQPTEPTEPTAIQKTASLANQETASSANQETAPSTNQVSKPASYLKLVNWKSKQSADKSLLIICRHQIDQPAQSFARPNAPSQFMTDYLKAIDDLLLSKRQALQIQLAHLTEAGLGKDNQPMVETVNNIAPDLILLLGDESIHHLFDKQMDVAQCRGKMHTLGPEIATKALVSYHPFSLIKNPSLKKLALEDLTLLVKFLTEKE